MNLKLNAAHQHVLELLKTQGIRCLVDDQYDNLSHHHLQLWLPEPLTEIEEKQLARFHKSHIAFCRSDEYRQSEVKQKYDNTSSYSIHNATLVKITMTDRITFEQAWQKRLGAVCQNTDVDLIAHRCDQPPHIDALTQAIADSFSEKWIKTAASMELFQVRYLVYNKAVRTDDTEINGPGLLYIWTDPDGENPKQARKANGRVTGNPGGIATYKRGHPQVIQGTCSWKNELQGREFEEYYQRRIRVNIGGVMVPMMNPQDLI